MGRFSIRFYAVKLLVTLLVNLFALAAAVILTLILQSADNTALSRLIASGVSGVLFLAYMFTSIRSMKREGTMGEGLFLLREISVYALFMLIPTAAALIAGNIPQDNLVFLFFLPNTVFFYLAKNAVLGWFFHTLVFALAAVLARLMKKKDAPAEGPAERPSEEPPQE